MHCVVETDSFVSAAKDLGMTDDDRHKIVLFLSENPEAGDLIKGTGGARKLRFGYRGRGKSGGVRVITFYCAADVPIFLLDIYDKTDRINLTQAERNELKDILGDMAETYRENNREKVRVIKENKQ